MYAVGGKDGIPDRNACSNGTEPSLDAMRPRRTLNSTLNKMAVFCNRTLVTPVISVSLLQYPVKHVAAGSPDQSKRIHLRLLQNLESSTT